MDRKATFGLALILAAAGAGCSRSTGAESVFRADSVGLAGQVPSGWEVDASGEFGTAVLAPDFVGFECPRVTLSRLDKPLTADGAREWHEVESRSAGGRENRVGPLAPVVVAGLNAWKYEGSAIRYPEHIQSGKPQAKPVRVKSTTYLVQSSGNGVEIVASAPEDLFDRYKPQLDLIVGSLKPLK